MAATAMMTLRLDPQLLASLKQRAKREGRSVSAEVVRLIRREVEDEPVGISGPRRTMGMFPSFDAPEIEVFRQARQAASASLTARGRSRKRKAP